MSKLQLTSDVQTLDAVETPEPLRFPVEIALRDEEEDPVMLDAMPQLLSGEQLLEAFDDISRRIEDLAEHLGCIDQSDGEDGPRAA